METIFIVNCAFRYFLRSCSKSRYSPAKHRSNGYNGKVVGRGCKNCATAAVKRNLDNSPGSTSHLLPDRNCTLRASLVTMNVFLVVPCSRHRCCIGCVSLRDAVALICVAELVVIGLCSLIALDIYLTDGRIFYTKEVEGHGAIVAMVFCAFCIISIPIICKFVLRSQFFASLSISAFILSSCSMITVTAKRRLYKLLLLTFSSTPYCPAEFHHVDHKFLVSW
ncbi:unnamed protein product [Haemonchus placei]|uniref:G_PROTEIN_RECEP_F3_4 domain-containing protein n=1 Tax=Haemonchus placei TaxID=6290 RepID=A0A0N4WE45_HAEPC|nr:unnamed protein product [Haemonchus placei]